MIDEKKIVVELRKLADEANIKCGKAMKNGDELKQMLEAGRCAGFATSLNIIETMKKNEWIPCSEKLPEEKGYYLTTTMYSEVYYDYWDGDNFDRTESVIAWQPLPEPYKE